jgi:hypothetical protein
MPPLPVQVLFDRDPRRVQRRGDCSRPNPHHASDPCVVEVGEVAEEQHEALTLRQLSDDAPNTLIRLGPARRGQVRRLTHLCAGGPPIASCVHDRAPRERLERPQSPDPAPPTHDADERILNGVRAQLLVTRDGDGNTEEGGISASVGHLDLPHHLVGVSCHIPYDRHGHSFLYRRD